MASLLLFELHEIDGDYFVQVIYNDEVMKMNGCEKYCSYPIFKGLLKDRILENWDEECLNGEKTNIAFLGINN